ncbi:putative DNA polymerase kappa [Leptomonas pyrrhocoris]|uniref:DNA polymerase kappa n=1 Tax=Leptomonas pyrrhocoris TaxID=157538 RepID=A0A0N0VHK1_LEPPY|nr:putative DNA polymerase kappa [Leptomonas pyrrhocoris]KPA85344.1 putative DNA polymerase kappa [Leptomonas pyrrhocoris]|eukprot:XP_015663783.1 putative DNA polymerase kappa [Leptomonas pyrrhocoris]
MSSNHSTPLPPAASCVRSEPGDALPHLVLCQAAQEALTSPLTRSAEPGTTSAEPRNSPRTSRATLSSPSSLLAQSVHRGGRSPSQSSSAERRTAATVAGAGTLPTSAKTSSSSSSAAPQVIVFDNTKAGLQAVDKEKTEALIREISKDSSFYQNEERKAKNRQRHVEALLVKTRHYEANVEGRPDVFRKVQREVADLEATIESHREFDHVYVHMDMDMFFAAVEMKKNPHYASLPLGIGGMGMLSTTNYVARQYGVRSGMPGFIGLRLCPELIIVPSDFPAYRVESEKFKAVVRTYDPSAHGLGMDEIMLCLNEYLALHYMHANSHDERFDAAERIIEECRRRVTEATGLTASAGIAPTPTLAKMASNYKKPNGQSSVRLFTREAVMAFLSPVAVRQVPGIGKSQESILTGLGIHTLGDVYAARHRLYCILTKKTYEFLLCSALGVGGMYDSREATSAEEAGDEESDGDGNRKSVGQERTFRQLAKRDDLQKIAYRNLRDAHRTLTEERLLASHVVLKLKFRSFQVKQHSKTLNVYTDDVAVLQRALDEVLIPVMDQFADFRLLGVRLEKLRPRAVEDGVEGATCLPKTDNEDETRQRTLSDYFKQRQDHMERRRAEMQDGHKRCRDSDVESADDVDSDIEVLTLPSVSRAAVRKDVKKMAAEPSADEKGDAFTQKVSTTLKTTAGKKRDASVVDLSDDETDKGDDDDGDVTYVE